MEDVRRRAGGEECPRDTCPRELDAEDREAGARNPMRAECERSVSLLGLISVSPGTRARVAANGVKRAADGAAIGFIGRMSDVHANEWREGWQEGTGCTGGRLMRLILAANSVNRLAKAAYEHGTSS